MASYYRVCRAPVSLSALPSLSVPFPSLSFLILSFYSSWPSIFYSLFSILTSWEQIMLLNYFQVPCHFPGKHSFINISSFTLSTYRFHALNSLYVLRSNALLFLYLQGLSSLFGKAHCTMLFVSIAFHWSIIKCTYLKIDFPVLCLGPKGISLFYARFMYLSLTP